MTVTPLPRRPAPAAFDAFYREHYVRVRTLIARHFPACDAEEIAQETMTRCYARFDELHADRDSWPWVSMVARNAAIDSMRRNRRIVSTEELPEASPAEDTTYESVVVSERDRSLRTALSRLRPADRQLIEDHDLAGIGCAEIAAVRDVSPNALRQRLFRARARLAAELREIGVALGISPAAWQSRLAQLARRADDVAPAAPALSAWGTAAVAAAVAAAGLFGAGGSAPVTSALGRGGATGEPIAAVDRADRPVAPYVPTEAAAPGSGSGGGRPPVRPIVKPKPDPLIPPLPYTSSHGNHLDEPEEDFGFEVRVPTPLGDVWIAPEMGGLPFYTTICTASEEIDCPEEGEDPPAALPG